MRMRRFLLVISSAVAGLSGAVFTPGELSGKDGDTVSASDGSMSIDAVSFKDVMDLDSVAGVVSLESGDDAAGVGGWSSVFLPNKFFQKLIIRILDVH